MTAAGADGFAARVHAFVRTVPRGRVTTYGDVAWAVGCPGGARAVARVMAAASGTGRTPCHRVVRADGSVAAGPSARKLAAELRREGVAVTADGKVRGFGRLRWPSVGPDGVQDEPGSGPSGPQSGRGAC